MRVLEYLESGVVAYYTCKIYASAAQNDAKEAFLSTGHKVVSFVL